jgi:hypothetical protein
MGIVTHGAPTDLVLLLRDQAHLETFVETGTYLGDTASWASRHFSRIVTIEQSPALYEAAGIRFAGNAQVECMLGDSREGLARIVPTLSEPALFWLDAHWSGGITSGEGDQCPLLDEIAVIDSAGLHHIILIDDARMFLAPPPPPYDADTWPAIDQVCRVLTAREPASVSVVDDVIIRVPLALRSVVIDHFRDKAMKSQANPPAQPGRGILARVRRIRTHST